MLIEKKLTKMILEFLPELQKFVTKEGMIYTKLMKALYGCIQSSRLWFERLTKVLRREGYVHCPTDPCVKRKVVSTRIYLLLIYVGDLLLLMDLQEARNLETVPTDEFQWITMSIGPDQSYLRMHIVLEKGRVVVDMIYFIQNCYSLMHILNHT